MKVEYYMSNKIEVEYSYFGDSHSFRYDDGSAIDRFIEVSVIDDVDIRHVKLDAVVGHQDTSWSCLNYVYFSNIFITKNVWIKHRYHIPERLVNLYELVSRHTVFGL